MMFIRKARPSSCHLHRQHRRQRRDLRWLYNHTRGASPSRCSRVRCIGKTRPTLPGNLTPFVVYTVAIAVAACVMVLVDRKIWKKSLGKDCRLCPQDPAGSRRSSRRQPKFRAWPSSITEEAPVGTTSEERQTELDLAGVGRRSALLRLDRRRTAQLRRRRVYDPLHAAQTEKYLERHQRRQGRPVEKTGQDARSRAARVRRADGRKDGRLLFREVRSGEAQSVAREDPSRQSQSGGLLRRNPLVSAHQHPLGDQREKRGFRERRLARSLPMRGGESDWPSPAREELNRELVDVAHVSSARFDAWPRALRHSGRGMNSTSSPGTLGNRPSFQSRRARAMRSLELETKFQSMCRSPSSGAPPTSTTRVACSA